ncbi:GAF domain-containing protein [Nodularia sp. NIES-3585]|uniref:GAF domain-containing protein n=1 Tax=Nodularia sp. NIES-3585 TaxID=1973477 RepID=UPI000B5CA70E|nr:GAF domain-containing protein [Nodularia sp. NIES-3585]GAX37848.1 adenylate cyclase, family 3 [Nodularia sp. NIES-3585]
MSYLIYTPETPNERVYELKPGVNTIGRQIDNTIVLLEETVSRHHAQIHVTPNSVTIQDCRSSNHTFVNQVKVDICQLGEGDQVMCGTVPFKFVHNLTTSRFKQIDGKELLGDNFKQIPLPEIPDQLQNLVSQNSRSDSILKFNTDNSQQQPVNKLKILLEVSKQLCSPDEPDQLLHKILNLLFEIMGIDRAAILLVDDKSQQLEAKEVKSREYIHFSQEFYSRRIVNIAYKSGDAIISQDPKGDQRFHDSVSILLDGIQNCMCVPLKNHQETIGVLYVDNLSPLVRYTEEDLDFLTALANQAAAAIHLSRQFHNREQKLKQQVLELQIQIDESKKESEVAEIIEGDFFQNLQQRAEQIRKKNELS